MKNLMQLHIDNLAREKRPVNVTKGGSEASLYIYDIISADFGVSALGVIDALEQVGQADVLHIYINSPGGDVFEGRAIMAALGRFTGKTIAHIDSLCASAATSIALACNEVEMSDGAFFMIHNASGMVWGDKTDMRQTADLLEKIEGSIVADYVKKTGKEDVQIMTWMDEETWFTTAQAIEYGFVDRMAKTPKASNTWNLAAFDKAPAALAEVRVVEPAAAAQAFVPEISSLSESRDMKTANTNRLRLLTIA
jgi:ATP-dependent protease ClpP protease subunit